MKTTIDIPDRVLTAARRLAEQEGTTVDALVELGLRKVLAEKRSTVAFKLRDATCKGKGLRPELEGISWERLRALACEGRGG